MQHTYWQHPLAALPGSEAGEHEAQIVNGTNRPDNLVAGGGPQIIYALQGDDIVHAGGGPDVVWAGNGDDIVFGQGGPDRLYGERGDDVLIGGPGPDEIDGGQGDDQITGGISADLLTGGKGADTFIYLSAEEAPAHGESHGAEGGGGGEEGGGEEGGPSVETITDFETGTDRIDLSALAVLAGLSTEPEAYSVWATQVGDNTLLQVDLDGQAVGDHPAEMAILLLGVDATTLDAGDFIF